MTTKQTIVIVGGGAAGIMFACHLDTKKYDVTLLEKTSRLGRKLLVAGEGGFNLSFDESPIEMIKKYKPSNFLKRSITGFSTLNLRDWLCEIGIETYVGSSNRIFPEKGIKPYQVVDKLISELDKNRVKILTNAKWEGWGEANEVVVNSSGTIEKLKFDHVIFALGGSSWAKTGSDGSWSRLFTEAGIKCIPFAASNCSWQVDWNRELLKKIEGEPLKNIVTTVADHSVRGEALVTANGIEGGAIYAQAYALRNLMANESEQLVLNIDLKPDINLETIVGLLTDRQKSIKHTLLNKLKISETGCHLLYHYLNKEDYNNPERLAASIKCFQLILKDIGNIDEAISSAGGIALGELTQNFELRKKTKNFCLGEMLDWDTRTGGYLLQACFSMGVYLARYFNDLSEN